MKQATCNQLRGACEAVITGATPEEMGKNCRAHVMEMMEEKDEAHLAAIESMKSLSPEDQQKWFEEFKAGFDALPDAE